MGFTLLELLIVIAIIAILSVALVMVLNPAELLKKSRDSQRISDLTTLKKAIGIYITTSRTPYLAGTTNTACKGTSSLSGWQASQDKIYYSYPSNIGGVVDASKISATNIDGTTFSIGYGPTQVTKENLGNTDNTGWIPINFSSLPDSSPISNLPIDPTNTIANRASPTLSDLVYRYACKEDTLTFELNAVFESESYTLTDLMMSKDGGNNDSYYEIGTNLEILNMESPLVAGQYTIIVPDHLPYMTVIGEDGFEWLDRNLGATKVASGIADTDSYGYLFQWGRGLDGHQKTTYSGGQSGTTSTLSSSDNPGHALFIKNPNPNYDWRSPISPNQSNLWAGTTINNICPSGFHVPTTAEWTHLALDAGITTANCGGASACLTTAANSFLHLPSASLRDYSSGSLLYQGSRGYYWSSGVSGTNGSSLYFLAAVVYPANANIRAYGFTVRCKKD
jgi:uncharacterized protein (TIGR02145 family)/prepilin-type N-terminal cleavage/methylation domain-containing protein